MPQSSSPRPFPLAQGISLLANEGRWAPEPDNGADELIEAVCDPAWTNADVLSRVLIRANRCDAAGQAAWMAQLLEFCVWESLSQPRRLDLCKTLVASGVPFNHEPSWRIFGGLIHIAAEAGSLEALRWARDLAPQDLFRPGGSFALSPLHCAAMRSDPEAPAVIEELLSWGVDPSLTTRDGRNALFRASDPLAAGALIKAGADPLALDPDGFCALGFWLESGSWELARLCFSADAPLASINQPLRAGSFSSSPFPRGRELPAALYARSPHGALSAHFSDNLLEMQLLGADFNLPGPDGQRPIERVADGAARARLEGAHLEQALAGSTGGARRGERGRL